MQQKHITFNEAVVNLLQLHNADEQLVQDYQEETTDEISDLFELLCSLIKQKEFEKYLTKKQKSKLNSDVTKWTGQKIFLLVAKYTFFCF